MLKSACIHPGILRIAAATHVMEVMNQIISVGKTMVMMPYSREELPVFAEFRYILNMESDLIYLGRNGFYEE